MTDIVVVAVVVIIKVLIIIIIIATTKQQQLTCTCHSCHKVVISVASQVVTRFSNNTHINHTWQQQ